MVPGEEPKPAQLQPSLTHFLLILVRGLVGSRHWSMVLGKKVYCLCCSAGWNVVGEVVSVLGGSGWLDFEGQCLDSMWMRPW